MNKLCHLHFIVQICFMAPCLKPCSTPVPLYCNSICNTKLTKSILRSYYFPLNIFPLCVSCSEVALLSLDDTELISLLTGWAERLLLRLNVPMGPFMFPYSSKLYRARTHYWKLHRYVCWCCHCCLVIMVPRI